MEHTLKMEDAFNVHKVVQSVINFNVLNVIHNPSLIAMVIVSQCALILLKCMTNKQEIVFLSDIVHLDLISHNGVFVINVLKVVKLVTLIHMIVMNVTWDLIFKIIIR